MSGQWTPLVLCLFHGVGNSVWHHHALPLTLPPPECHSTWLPWVQPFRYCPVLWSPLQDLMALCLVIVACKFHKPIECRYHVWKSTRTVFQFRWCYCFLFFRSRDWLSHKVFGHKAPCTPDFIFSFEFCHLVPSLWWCLVVDTRFQSIFWRSVSSKTHASISYHPLLDFDGPESLI